jgi:hypothetical protein
MQSSGTEDTKYCHECGQQLLMQSRYCDRCGAEQLSPDVIDSGQQPATQHTAAQQSPQQSGDYYNLFGDVYWDKSALPAGIFVMPFIVWLIPRDKLVEWFPEFWRWLILNHPDMARTLYDLWPSVPLILFGFLLVYPIELHQKSHTQ